jgi:mono/diheme cytochrome c family protein
LPAERGESGGIVVHRRTLTALLASALFTLSTGAAAPEPLIERGAYLVNGVMACANCHTPRDASGPILSKTLAGGRVFDTPVFKVWSSNLTSDKDTGIGGWTDAQLKTFMLTGARPSGVPVAPIMPTAFYQVLTPRDLDALVVYLRSVTTIRNEVPPPDYKQPFAHRDAPFADRRLSDAEMSDPVKRGMYLVTLGHCLECHTPDTGGAHDVVKLAGKGGRTFSGPWGESRSSNITSHKAAGIGGWTDDEIKRAITQGISRDGHKLKPPMAFAAYAGITAQDQDAIVAFLRTLTPLE